MTAQVDHMQNLKSLLRLFQTITNDSSFDTIQKGLDENASLKQDLEQQRLQQDSERTVFALNLSRIQGHLHAEKAKTGEQSTRIGILEDTNNTLTSELEAEKTKVTERDEKLAENAKTNSDLQGQLDAARAEIITLKNTVQEQDTRHNNISAQLEVTSAELNQRKTELGIIYEELGSLKQLLRPMKTESKYVVSKSLESVFETVHGLATTFFSGGLPKAVLDNPELWTNFRSRITWLPLPATNTSEAKQMRIAACIGALGSMLAALIFVPVYVEPDNGEITKFLSDVSFYDHKREVHLRSVFLDAKPDEQDAIRQRRTVVIGETIYKTFGQLLHDDKKSLFKAKLQETCTIAVTNWEFIRQCEIKVDTLYPPFDPTEQAATEFNEKNWNPICLTPDGTPPEKAPEANGSPKSKTSSKTNGTGRNRNSNRDRDDSPPPTNGVHIDEGLHFGHSDVQRPLWPAFGIGDDDLSKGYVLLNSQAKPARQEMGDRRTHRRSIRNSSMSRPPSSVFLVR